MECEDDVCFKFYQSVFVRRTDMRFLAMDIPVTVKIASHQIMISGKYGPTSYSRIENCLADVKLVLISLF